MCANNVVGGEGGWGLASPALCIYLMRAFLRFVLLSLGLFSPSSWRRKQLRLFLWL